MAEELMVLEPKVQTEENPKPKEHKLARKLLFCVLLILLLVSITASAFTIVGMTFLVGEGVPWMNQESVENLLAKMMKEGELESELASYISHLQAEGEVGDSEVMKNLLGSFLADRILHLAIDESFAAANEFAEKYGVKYSIVHPYGRPLGGTLGVSDPADSAKYSVAYTEEETGELIRYSVALSFNMQGFRSILAERYEVQSFWVLHREAILVSFIVSILLSLCLLVATCNMVRRKDLEVGHVLDKLPIGLFALIVLAMEYLLWKPFQTSVLMFLTWHEFDLGLFKATGTWILMVALPLGLIYFLVWRLKHPGWYRGTFCYWIFMALKKLVLGWVNIFRNLALVWKALLLELVITAAECAIIFAALPLGLNLVRLLVAFGIFKVILIPFLLWYCIALGKVEKGLREIAGGNLEAHVDVEKLPGALQSFGKDINSMAGSVSDAVEERMKSERLKTELITNVSHDIKTPLTSIINFSDLIAKEETENEKVKEYADHLHAQSSKLKKLIEDLIEASKASTGNMEAHLEPCDASVLLGQCLGEYETRLREKGLELILKQSKEPLRIMADTRMLWRVFDNLMSNVCKYSQENTRVYLSAERRQGAAVIMFKNVSKYALDMSPEELMERFVRGDLSRHTEGHGLGLSIARSLMELQGGQITLDVDADLFKATLEFPLVSEA
ncbi:MAG: sensor histidine kinase [Lachnospiraceae bacterium]|nr:sensor histidine kinase [Lachnospiraceae bacterium]